MKMVSRAYEYNTATKRELTTLVCEQRWFVFWKKKRTFTATKEYPTGYWNWLEMPDMTTVPDVSYFQLCAWNMRALGR